MVDRLNKAYLSGSPTYAQSAALRGSTSAVFGGVSTIVSGSSAIAVTGVDVRSESVVFIGAPQFTTSTVSGAAKPFGITSLTVVVSGTLGGFMLSTVDSAACATSVTIPWQIWRVGQVRSVQ